MDDEWAASMYLLNMCGNSDIFVACFVSLRLADIEHAEQLYMHIVVCTLSEMCVYGYFCLAYPVAYNG